MRVLFSGFHDSNHSKSGGYDKITNIDLEKKILLSNNYIGGNAPIASQWSRIPFYLLDIHTRMLRNRYDITHFFYGELTSLPFLPYHKSKKHKTVVTLHLRIEDHKCINLYLNQLRSYDGIIVLSSSQKELLETKYGIKSTFIPHGFSRPEFKRVPVKDINDKSIDSSKINISTIGSNYRDIETLKYAIKEMVCNKKIQFHLIGVNENVKDFVKDMPNVSVYSRLDDDQYYTLLSQMDYNFLPLTFATANNTLLEAQYLNVKSILPKISGSSDYAAPAPLNLFYEDKTDLIKILSNLEKDRKDTRLEEFANLNFNWEVIYKQLSQYYSRLYNCKW